MTTRLQVICENLNVELLDHLIAGKESVYSFAEEKSVAVSYNEDYQKMLKKQSIDKKKNRQIEFDM